MSLKEHITINWLINFIHLSLRANYSCLHVILYGANLTLYDHMVII